MDAYTHLIKFLVNKLSCHYIIFSTKQCVLTTCLFDLTLLWFLSLLLLLVLGMQFLSFNFKIPLSHVLYEHVLRGKCFDFAL